MTDTAIQSSFAYEELDAETRIVVQQRTGEIKALMKRAASDIIEIGQKLIEVKARLGYGSFGDWLEAEFEWSARIAQQFITVAERFAGIEKRTLFAFGSSALRLLARPSTPDSAFDEAIERAEAGEAITYTAAREMVAAHKDAETSKVYALHPYQRPAFDYDPPIYKVSPAKEFIQTPEAREDVHRMCPYCACVYQVDVETGDISECPNCAKMHAFDPLHEQDNLRFPQPPDDRVIRPVSYHISDDSYEWYTPAEYIEAARTVMGSIDLDPASSDEAQTVVKATTYYTKAQDGLAQEWAGNVWLNPPYNMPLVEAFIDKLIANVESGAITATLVLTNNSTDTGWFHKLLRYPVCFTRGRIRFWSGDDILATRQGQAIFYIGDNLDGFTDVFSAFGKVMHCYA